MRQDPHQIIRRQIEEGRFSDAITSCIHRVETEDDSECLFLLGVISGRIGKFEEALNFLNEALVRLPDRADIAFERATIFARSNQLDVAIDGWRQVLVLEPQHRGARFNLGMALGRTGQFDEAEQFYQSLLSSTPDDIETLYNLGVLYFRALRREDALVCFERTVELDEAHADAWSNLCLSALRLGKTRKAIEAGRRAVQLAPKSPGGHTNLGFALLKNRDLAEGFAEIEWRRLVLQAPLAADGALAWTEGVPHAKRIVVFAEQGHGDAIHFFRYIKSLADAGNTITLVVHEALRRLASHVDGVTHVLSFDEACAGSDLFAPLMSLPHLMKRTSVNEIDGNPYLRVPDQDIVSITGNGSRKFGLVWQGNTVYEDDANRSITLEALKPLFELPGIDWVSLQMGGGEEIADLGLADRMTNPMNGVKDFWDTACIIRGLDGVIAVDTAVAHLAGALGVETSLLLAHASDWRWFDDDGPTPWYDAVTIMRQQEPGNWTSVIEQLKRKLE